MPFALVLGMLTYFLLAWCAGIYAGENLLPAATLYWYGGASIIAFLAYAKDKSAARNNAWRVQENTLLTLGLLGGWPGALTAQKLLRHKSQKTIFKIYFWTSVALNCSVVAGLLVYSGYFTVAMVFNNLAER